MYSSLRQRWSIRQDLNLRSPAPKAGALPGYATNRLFFLETSGFVEGSVRGFGSVTERIIHHGMEVFLTSIQVTFCESGLFLTGIGFHYRWFLIRFAFWYPEPDSNRHAFGLGILSPMCLPIPPSGLVLPTYCITKIS